MNAFVELLIGTPLLLLFVVIGVGYLVGSIRVFGFSLGPAAVLFAGIFFGAWDSRLRIPDFIYILGLILFVYTIGLQSGPTFFSSFGRRGVRANLFALGIIGLGSALSWGAAKIFLIDGPSITGVFCGAMTNTPALAASLETLRVYLQNSGAQPAAVQHLSNAPVIGYGVAYPFGVIGVLLGFYFFRKILETKGRESVSDTDGEATGGPIISKTFRVVNPSIIGRSVGSLFSDAQNRGVVLSRLRRGDVTSLVYADTMFAANDLVVAVGTPGSLDRMLKLFGQESTREIQTEIQDLEYRRVVVSDKKVVGRTIRDLDLQEMMDATITRVRRGDVDFVPTGDTVMEMGDRIRVLTWVGNMDRVTKYFGDSIKSSSEADFLSVSIGVVLGVLLGLLPLPLPGGSTFMLGFAGGPLIAGLVLGRLQRTGTIIWGMPFSANLTLRQVGLLLFLAGIGTKAGVGFVETILSGGWKLMIVGAFLTTSMTCMTMILGVKLLKLSFPAVMGMMSGIQTQPACLAYANEHSTTNAPDLWYASVYPASMISKIVLAQLLVRLLV